MRFKVCRIFVILENPVFKINDNAHVFQMYMYFSTLFVVIQNSLLSFSTCILWMNTKTCNLINYIKVIEYIEALKAKQEEFN